PPLKEEVYDDLLLPPRRTGRRKVRHPRPGARQVLAVGRRRGGPDGDQTGVEDVGVAARPLRLLAAVLLPQGALPGRRGGQRRPGCGRAASRVVFLDAKGRELTEADLAGLTGPFSWEVGGRDNVPAKAQELY